MPHIVADRILQTSTTTGTGAMTVGAAVPSYRSLASFGAINGDTVDLFFEAVDANGAPNGDWEIGTYTCGAGATTLVRTVVRASSNGGAAVNWGAGTKRVGSGVDAWRLQSLITQAQQATQRQERPMPRRVAAKLNGLQGGTKKAIRSTTLGDSLGESKCMFVLRELALIMGASANRAPSAPEDPFRPGQCDVSVVAGTFPTTPADNYTYWPTGPLGQIVASGRTKWVQGGGDPVYSKMTVFYVKQPGAGTFDVLVTPDGGSESVVQSINASSGTIELGTYTHTQTYGRSKFELLGTAGNVRLIGVMESGDEPGVYHMPVSQGGLALADAMSSATCRTLWTQFLAAWAPDLFFHEMDDTYALADLNLMRDCLTTGQPSADKFFIATTPTVSQQTSSTRRDILRDWTALQDNTFFFFDGWAPVAPYSTLTALGWEGDGGHPSYACQAYLSSLFIKQFGFRDSVYGVSPQAVNNVNEPSRFSSGSSFYSKRGGVSFEDPEYWYGGDTDLIYSRTLRLGGRNDDGSFAEYTGWVFGGIGGMPHSVPESFTIGARANNRGTSSDTSQGYWRFNFYDDATATQGMNLRAGGYAFFDKTLAETGTATSRTGVLAGITDAGPGGSGWRLCYSDGTDWRRVRDDKIAGSAL